jgi:hypothetical protein
LTGIRYVIGQIKYSYLRFPINPWWTMNAEAPLRVDEVLMLGASERGVLQERHEAHEVLLRPLHWRIWTELKQIDAQWSVQVRYS